MRTNHKHLLALETPPLHQKRRLCLNADTSFSRLPHDTRVAIFSFLEMDDLVSVAMTSRQGRLDTFCPALNQERVIHYDGRSFESIGDLLQKIVRDAVARERVPHIRRFTRLKIVNHQQLLRFNASHSKVIVQSRLQNVRVLDLSTPKTVESSTVNNEFLPQILSEMLPNLVEADLSNTSVMPYAVWDLSKRCKSLAKFTFNRWKESPLCLGEYFKDSDHIKEHYMDTCNFLVYDDAEVSRYLTTEGDRYPFFYCAKNLERVSILNATYNVFLGDRVSRPIPQEALMKLALQAPNLKWFRSDLKGNFLKKCREQRPEVTFLGQ